MKHSSTPAYTIGQKFPAEPETTNLFTPGPMAYNTRQYSIEVPSTVFGKANRSNSLKKEDFPGPGSYQISSFVDNVAVKKIAKRKNFYRDFDGKANRISPGPGSYNPKYYNDCAKYSMGNKVFAIGEEKGEKIGPCEYSPNYKLVHTVKSTTFTKSKRFRPDHDDSPGPGKYELQASSPSPSHSFSKQPRSIFRTFNTPGPDSYNIPGLSELLRQKPGKKIYPNHDRSNLNENFPGPGSYMIQNPKSLPSISIGRGKRPSIYTKNNSPGPGQYSPEASSSPGKTFGKSKRRGMGVESKVPGPGSYEYKSFLVSGPKYSLIGRKDEEDLNEPSPGPGYYNANFNAPKAHSFHASIGKSKKTFGSVLGTGNRPGPGDYEVCVKSDLPSWSFNKAKKESLENVEEPGPGSYEIPSTIPDIPKYLKPKKNKYSKY